MRTMPIPATPRKSPMKALVTLTPLKPINASESVVNVVAKAPIASAVGLPSWALRVIGTGMYCTDGSLDPEGDVLPVLAYLPAASFS